MPRASATGEMQIDGFHAPVDLKVRLDILPGRILCDFAGTSGLDKKGINVPLVYTKAYACYALKCAIAPEIPNNAASLAPFEITAPVDSIVNAVHPAPVALRHVIGHMIPDTVYDALDKILPDTIPAEGAGCLCNFQVSMRPRTDEPAPADAVRSEVLAFNSGGSGARPAADGMNATAFPSGVMTMPVEATEHAGPVVIWRKELRPDSGGAGSHRGGLGQYMEVGAREGYEFDFQAMFDRVDHPARGRQGGFDGAATTIAQDEIAPYFNIFAHSKIGKPIKWNSYLKYEAVPVQIFYWYREWQKLFEKWLTVHIDAETPWEKLPLNFSIDYFNFQHADLINVTGMEIIEISNNMISSSISAQIPIFRDWKIDAEYRHTFEHNLYSDGIGDKVKVGLIITEKLFKNNMFAQLKLWGDGYLNHDQNLGYKGFHFGPYTTLNPDLILPDYWVFNLEVSAKVSSMTIMWKVNNILQTAESMITNQIFPNLDEKYLLITNSNNFPPMNRFVTFRIVWDFEN